MIVGVLVAMVILIVMIVSVIASICLIVQRRKSKKQSITFIEGKRSYYSNILPLHFN